jgi:hypothetical protein
MLERVPVPCMLRDLKQGKAHHYSCELTYTPAGYGPILFLDGSKESANTVVSGEHFVGCRVRPAPTPTPPPGHFLVLHTLFFAQCPPWPPAVSLS